MESSADNKVPLKDAEVAAEQADGLNEEVIQSSTTHPPGSLPPNTNPPVATGSETQGTGPSSEPKTAGQPDKGAKGNADTNASDKAAVDTSADEARKTNHKFIVHLKRLSASFVPRPTLVGHLKEGELEKIEQAHKEQQEQNTATAEGQKESQTQQVATNPDDATQPCTHHEVDTVTAANPTVSAASETYRPRKTPRHTVVDIQRRLSNAFRTPLYHHGIVAEENRTGDAKPDKEQPPTPVANHNETTTSPDVTSPTKEMPPLPDKPEPEPVAAAAATATATDGAHVTEDTTDAGGVAAPINGEEKPAKRRMWQSTLKGMFRGPIAESKILHPEEWTRDNKAQQEQQQPQRKDTSAVAPAPQSTSVEDNDGPSASPPSVGFFAKMKQAIKDEFGRDFPASDRAQALGKTRKKIGTVRVHLREGKVVAAERLSSNKKQKKSKDEADASLDADASADESKKKKKGDEDDKSPKGPPSIPTEHAIYSQDVGAGQHQQQQQQQQQQVQQQAAQQTVAPVPTVNVVDS